MGFFSKGEGETYCRELLYEHSLSCPTQHNLFFEPKHPGKIFQVLIGFLQVENSYSIHAALKDSNGIIEIHVKFPFLMEF